MKILAIGRSEYLLKAIERISIEHRIVGIVTGPSTAESIAKEHDFAALATKLECGFRFAKSIDAELLKFCRKSMADVAVSVNWMSIIDEEFIESFPKGVLNAHCGDLPLYRGNAILNWALLRGEKEITASVHTMVPGELDVGNIYAVQSFSIDCNDDVGDLVRKFGEITPALFSNALHSLEKGTCMRSHRDVVSQGGFRCYPRLPVDGCIDWQESACAIHRLVRASARPYPGAFTCVIHDGELRKLIIWKARLVSETTVDVGVPGHVLFNDSRTGETHVYTGEGVLALQEVQFEGGDVFCPGNFFRSIRMRFGLSQGLLIQLLNGLKIGRLL